MRYLRYALLSLLARGDACRARAKKLSKKRRSEIAKNAAQARWSGRD